MGEGPGVVGDSRRGGREKMKVADVDSERCRKEAAGEVTGIV